MISKRFCLKPGVFTGFYSEKQSVRSLSKNPEERKKGQQHHVSGELQRVI